MTSDKSTIYKLCMFIIQCVEMHVQYKPDDLMR